MEKDEKLAREIKDSALHRMDESSRMIRLCFSALDEDDIWRRPNASSNSIGNLVLHLCGNIGQYVISSLGGCEDVRDREGEFNARSGHTGAALLERLMETVERAKKIIRECPYEELLRSREVQGFRLTGTGIVMHVVEHYSYHTGQIAFWIKLLRDRDLGFYRGVDLNTRNRGNHAG